MTVPPESAELLKKWQTASLRITGFQFGALELDSVRWWEALTGKPADSRNARPGIGQLVESGVIDGRVIQLQIQPGRIDWLLLPKDDPESEAFASLGDYDSSLVYFSELISKWMVQAPPLNRLAFGALLLIPTVDQAQATEILARILQDVTLNWAGIKEFVLQVNRPEPSAVLPEIGPINRLVKWQTIVQKKIVANLLPASHAPFTTSEQTAVSLELDMNTVTPTDATKQIPPGRLIPVLVELIEHATHIASKRILP
jgi:hypothetical protein